MLFTIDFLEYEITEKLKFYEKNYYAKINEKTRIDSPPFTVHGLFLRQ